MQRIWQWRGLLVIVPGVASMAIAIGATGLFQVMEWATLDLFFRGRSPEPLDERIVIVTIDEADLSYIGRWPIPDVTLAKAIENIKKQQPRAIGLDLYRDLPVEPGYQTLVEVFKSTPNLMGVEKVAGENTVAPPPTLNTLDQVGIVDLVLDGDGKVRRGLLSYKTKDGKIRLSLGARLSLLYLEAEGIHLQMLDEKRKHLGLGKAVFVPLSKNDGGYVGANTGGYQILLNFRGSDCRKMAKNKKTLPCSFPTLSITDVIEDRIPSDLMRDQIVLIGATGQSLNDFFLTPYSSNFLSIFTPSDTYKQTPGVVIHAHLISQLLSAAIDGRPLVRFFAEPMEWLWILVCSVIGSSGIWMLLQTASFRTNVIGRWIVLGTGIFLPGSIPIAASYLAFLGGWWLPVMSPLVATIGSAMAIALYQAEQLQREMADLEILLETTTEHGDAVEADLHHKALQTAHESERRLAQFLEAMPVGIGVLDANGKPYYVNQKAIELLGKGVAPDATADQISEVYQLYKTGTNQEYPSEDLPIVRALRGEKATADDVEIHQENKIIPVEAWSTPIYDAEGNIAYAIAAFQDITERKKAEVERQEFTHQLLQLNVAYGRFVPHEFLQILNKKSIINVELGNHVHREMTVLFSDIRDFTTLSENMTPEDNFKFINAYLSRMEPLIIENHGFIDKYIGDAIMALFSGDPFLFNSDNSQKKLRSKGADDAVKAGIAMLHQLREYNQTRQTPERPPLKIGIGINTGSLMLGTVGGQKRMDGTVISDSVNLASRIERLTKNYAVSLLISQHTFLELENPTNYAIRLIDRVQVKGKSESVTVYEVFDADPPEIHEGKLATQGLFEEALLLYNMSCCREALNLFQECVRLNPKDKVAHIYVKRCQQDHGDRFLTNSWFLTSGLSYQTYQNKD